MKLDGKVAVITGGASGMGAATARLFVEEGARVVIGDIQDEKGEAVAAELGASVVYTHADVSAGEDLQSLMRSAIDRFGGLDVLFNNAGVALPEGEIIDCTEQLFDRILATNLKSVWVGDEVRVAGHGRSGWRLDREHGLHRGLRALRHEAAYGASKAGIIQLTRVCAIDYAERGIRANCILPRRNPDAPDYDNPVEAVVATPRSWPPSWPIYSRSPAPASPRISPKPRSGSPATIPRSSRARRSSWMGAGLPLLARPHVAAG